MTREAFIRKWLANPQKQYNEQCRDEMRDDLDLVIESALRQPPVISSFCDCISRCGVDGEEHGKWYCKSCKKEIAK